MRQIAIIGTGYVGLVTGTCFAELGNTVICLDNDQRKIDVLCRGGAPFFEPQLLEMIVRNKHAGRLSFSSDVEAGVRASEIVFIAVGTPMGDDGNADLSAVREVAATIGQALNGPKIVVSKSTVPVETGEMVSAIIAENALEDQPVDVVSNSRNFSARDRPSPISCSPTGSSSARAVRKPKRSCATCTHRSTRRSSSPTCARAR